MNTRCRRARPVLLLAALLALAAPIRSAADERSDLSSAIEAYRAADFAKAIRLLEPLGESAALGDEERARALGYLGLSLLATSDRERAVVPLRRLAALAPGVRLGEQELAPEYREFFDEVRRGVLATVRLHDRTSATADGRVRFAATLDDPLGVVSRVEARTAGGVVALAATELGARGTRSLAAESRATGASYRIVALARDRTEVARTDDLPIPGAPPLEPLADPPPERSSRAWLWATLGAAAAVAIVAVVIVLVTTSSDPSDSCGSLGCLRF